MTRFFVAAVCAASLITYFGKGAIAADTFNMILAANQIGFAALQFFVAAPTSVHTTLSSAHALAVSVFLTA